MKKLFMTIMALVLTLLLAACGVLVFFSTERGQQWLYDKGIKTLAETLQTRVAVKHIGLNLWTGNVVLQGLEVDDRSAKPMLRIDTLEANLDLKNIWHREIGIEGIRLYGGNAMLYKEHPDTAANYQFVFDELSKKKKKKDTEEKDRKKPFVRFVMDLVEADIEHVGFTWDILSEPAKAGRKLDVNHLDVSGFAVNVKGKIPTDSTSERTIDITLRNLAVTERKSGMRLGMHKGTFHIDKDSCEMTVEVDTLHYAYDNGKPRKNTGRPHRGWFDPGHLDVKANINATINGGFLSPKGSDDRAKTLVTVNSAQICDRKCGLDIRSMKAVAEISKDTIKARNISIQLPHTGINISKVALAMLHDKEKVMRIHNDCHVSARVILQDIARPFAPPLAAFTTPLNLNVNVSGDLQRLVFGNIRISTPDGRLRLNAGGDLCDVLKKQRLCLHFNGISMSARGGIKEQIVKHFAKQVRLKMMKQMAAIGDITYSGTVGIYHKREDISGRLCTKYGNINFAFTLDGHTKYMTGTMSTDGVELGSIMNIKGLQVGNAKASYSFNVSKKRNKSPDGGRLPQGWLKADVDGAKYKFISFRDINAEIQSDGANAVGTVTGKQKYISVICDFIYRQTDKEQSFRVKPHLKLNNKEEKAKKQKGGTETTDTAKKPKQSIFKKLFSKKKQKEESQ